MRVLVVGGCGGIGEAVIRLLRKEGHNVFFTYRANSKKAVELKKLTGNKRILYDFHSEPSITGLFKLIDAERFDGLVYTAAEKFTRETILQMSAKVFLKYINDQVSSYYRVSQAFAESLKSRKARGAIVNVLSSVVLGLPPAKQAAYVCSKYTQLGLTRCQSVEFGAFNVRVNSVSPSMTSTAFNADLPERFIEMHAESLPMRRLATADEVANTIIFLLSPGASYLQGVNIPVCGGLAC